MQNRTFFDFFCPAEEGESGKLGQISHIILRKKNHRNKKESQKLKKVKKAVDNHLRLCYYYERRRVSGGRKTKDKLLFDN